LNLYSSIKNLSAEWKLILCFASLKIAIHFLSYSNFELHRDAYLYYAQSEHLAWGFSSIPPLNALLGKIATLIFGNTTFGLRFFPALIGGATVIIIGMAVNELGGKSLAIVLASLAFILSPAYLHSNALFQPVSLNQFFWLLSEYLLLLMIKREDPKLWLWIALVFGLAFLNKYSIVFLDTALGLALLFSPYRRFYKSKYFGYAVGLGLVIILPNLVWQSGHQWPVFRHLAELRESQLVHVHLSSFFFDQLLMNSQALLIWFGALLILLFYKKEAEYRVFGILFGFVLVILALGSGKSYYSLGAYPMLFVFGAYFTEKYITKHLVYIIGFMIISMLFALYISQSFDGIPFSTVEKIRSENGFNWEDGVSHDIPQDMADMTGWQEIGEKVSTLFLSLSPEAQSDCDIFCYHYGQAGAVMFYGKKHQLPQPISFNDSFVFWDPDSLTKDYMIWVHAGNEPEINPDSLLPGIFEKVELKGIIENDYFRENGTRIYLCQTPKEAYKTYYKARIKTLKGSYQNE
jgi:hypothetical protein